MGYFSSRLPLHPVIHQASCIPASCLSPVFFLSPCMLIMCVCIYIFIYIYIYLSIYLSSNSVPTTMSGNHSQECWLTARNKEKEGQETF